MTQLPEHETQAAPTEAQDALVKGLAKTKAGEAGLAWATPDGDREGGKDASAPQPVGVDDQKAEADPEAVQTSSPSEEQDTPTSLLARLRRGQPTGPGGTPQERAEQALPTEAALGALLQSAPMNVRLHGEADAPLVAQDRQRALLREPRAAGPINEDDFKQESDLRPEDLEELRAERTELLRTYLRTRTGAAGQPVSMQDFQQSLLTEGEWLRRSPWLDRTVLAPWSVQHSSPAADQAAPASAASSVLMMAPTGRARFGSFVRVAQTRGQTGTTSGREALEAQTRRPEAEEALAKARLEVVRAATARLFADWEQEADDLPPEEQNRGLQAHNKS